ncbi:MAG: SDR family oxidoreductase [Planctomycetaceae bacterium]
MILDLFKLDGRVALVTGGSRGLGQAMAVGLAQAGADIACVSRTGEDRETRRLVEAAHAERMKDEGGRMNQRASGQTDTLTSGVLTSETPPSSFLLPPSKGRFLSLKADLAEPPQRRGLVDRVVRELGRIDILVNNAGSGTRHPPEAYPDDEWRHLLEVHLNAAFDLSQQAFPHMVRRGRGKIINVGSVMTFEGGWHIPAYAAAKHGIAGLTKSLATAWSGQGINVNCIAPGYFETDLAGVLMNDPVRGPQIDDRIPAGRWGQPDELAGLCVFLASDASNYMHGSIVPIDGGWLAR